MFIVSPDVVWSHVMFVNPSNFSVISNVRDV